MPFIEASNDDFGLLLTFSVMFFFGLIGFLIGWGLDRVLPGPSIVIGEIFDFF